MCALSVHIINEARPNKDKCEGEGPVAKEYKIKYKKV